MIGSKVGGIPEIINNKNGLMVESENSEKLTNVLLDLVSHPDKRQKLAQAGHKTVLEKFDAKKMAKEYEREYAAIT